jgi:pimeloyl-ACP methyl ester carboxylesterase
MTKSEREQRPALGSEVWRTEPNEKILRANGVNLCVETFGDPADPAILLIHGAATPMHGWEDEFCESLAAARRFVIRYDHRDTGRSVSYEPGAPQYTLRDLTADAVGLLDTFDLGSAHLVGRSMGGGIAMLAALDYPDRVTSLTLVGTSPGVPTFRPCQKSSLLTSAEERTPTGWIERPLSTTSSVCCVCFRAVRATSTK